LKVKKSAQKNLDSKSKKITSFDPNGPALSSANLFGLPFSENESDIVIVPVPWEATVSYGGGTAKGPDVIFEASMQVDLFHPEFPDLWKRGLFMHKVSDTLAKKSKDARKSAEKIIDALSEGKSVSKDSDLKQRLAKVNASSLEMINEVHTTCKELLQHGKLVGLVGGDHSTPLGFIRALAEKYKSFGILQIDAHMDLRKAYEGFTWSHASIMYNALQLDQVKKLVQVGIRDFCKEEADFAEANRKRISVFTYADVAHRRFEGVTWRKQCEAIIEALPEQVYISFDIDGLDPKLCPNTGTPVAGGFEFHEITYLLSMLAKSKKKIIGFDLNEVSPGKDDWDGNVGARMLFHLCGVLAASQKK
jgi:agmatinase